MQTKDNCFDRGSAFGRILSIKQQAACRWPDAGTARSEERLSSIFSQRFVVQLLCMAMTKTIYIDGLAVELTRKRVKKMNMRIKAPDGRVVISAPYLVPEKAVIAFVRSRRDWIDRTAARVRAKAAAHPEPSDRAEKEARRRDLKRRIEERLPLIEEATGLYCSGWTVRDMHTRWGSCNTTTRHINLSLMLATRSDAELDYVILHELAHTVVPNHGADFYALMDRYMPGWKKIRKALNY